MNIVPKYSWSFSSLGLMSCPKKYELIRAKKIIQSQSSTAGDEGSRIHKLIEDYINEDKWDDELFKWKRLIDTYKAKGGIGEAEYAFKWIPVEEALITEPKTTLVLQYDHHGERYLVPCAMDDPDVWFRAILDWVKVDIEAGTAEVADWKTGRVRPSKQLQLYAWIIFLAHPEVTKVKCVFHWINYNDQLPQWFDRKDMYKLFEPFKETLDQIDHCYRSDVWLEIPGELIKKTKRGANCTYCPVTDEHCSEGIKSGT